MRAGFLVQTFLAEGKECLVTELESSRLARVTWPIFNCFFPKETTMPYDSNKPE